MGNRQCTASPDIPRDGADASARILTAGRTAHRHHHHALNDHVMVMEPGSRLVTFGALLLALWCRLNLNLLIIL